MDCEVACFGEPLIGFYGEEGSSESELIPFKLIIGGDTSNVALAVSKLGHSSAYITKLGSDFLAELLLRAWERAGVNTENVLRDADRSTGVYFALFNRDRRHRFVYKRRDSAAAGYSLKDAEAVNLEGLELFHTSGITQAVSRSSLEASFYLLEKCKEREITISYDLNYRGSLWSPGFFSSVAWYTIEKYADIVSLNIEEAEVLGLKGSPEDITEAVLDKGPGLVSLKLGGTGSVTANRDEAVRGKAYQVAVKDTVGAGDAFTAGIIVGYLEEMELRELQQLSNAVAAVTCTSNGSTGGQPSREEVEAFMRASREAD